MNALAPPRALAPALLRLAVPVAFARLGIMGMGVCDTIVVGQIAPHELGALALGLAPVGVLLVTGIGLLSGVQVLGARVIGAGDPEAAGAVWRKGVSISLVMGMAFGALLWIGGEALLRALGVAPEFAAAAARVTRILAFSLPFQFIHLACAAFLEAIRRPGANAAVIWAANALNLALNLALVPAHGAVGSAMATIVGRVFMAVALVAWILFSTQGRTHGAHRRRGEDPHGYRGLLHVGVAAAVSQLAESGAFSAMTVIAARISPAAVATYQVILNVVAVVFMIALGFSAAAGVLVSEAIGSGDKRRAARAGWTALGFNTACMAVCALVLVMGADGIAGAFTSDAALIASIAAMAPLCALIVFPDGAQGVMAQALRGRGDNWFPSASHILAYVFLQPALAFVLGERMGRGVAGLLEAIVLASIVSAGVLIARFWFLARQRAEP